MVFKPKARTPRNYDDTRVVNHRLSDVLHVVLEQVSEAYKDRPDLILASWPELIGPQLAPMTQAVSFEDGVLAVKVKNSTLYSLLSQNDKPRLVQNLRKKFPKVQIKTIHFKFG
jgi:hypothetical protein